jgi:hypothetical protein
MPAMILDLIVRIVSTLDPRWKLAKFEARRRVRAKRREYGNWTAKHVFAMGTELQSGRRQPGQLTNPSSQVTPQQIYALKETLGQQLMSMLQSIGGNQGGKLIYRDLVPNDLFVSTAQTQARFFNPGALVANAFSTDVFSGAGAPLPQNKALGIYGIYNLAASPQVNVLKFKLGSQTFAQVFLDPIYADEGTGGTYSYINPVRWGPLDSPIIDMLASVAVGSGAEQIGFLGIVAEPEGVNITPRAGGAAQGT